ncbi:hypothetical protein VQ056_24370 [Paenibacillus sp. JTLBN-2024]
MRKSELVIGIQSLPGNVLIVQKRGGGNYNLMLIPKKEAQPINFKIYEEYTPSENKLEVVSGTFLPFNKGRERLLMMCLYNTGLREFISLLQIETKKELLELLQQDLKE